MNALMQTTSVMAAPLFDPGAGRVALDMPAGMTLAEIVNQVFPNASEFLLSNARVALVSLSGSVVVLRDLWHRVRPRPGVRVVIRIIPSGDGLRSILQVVVSIAAIALGQFWAPALMTLGLSQGLAAGIIGLGVTVVGNLLINALVPPASTKTKDQKNSYQISGWNNKFDPDGVIPEIHGKIRYAPPFAATSWTEIVGDLQYILAVFNYGVGPITFSGHRIGDTATTDYDEIEMEVREGLPTDAPLTLYSQQIVEQAIGVELTRPRVRDDQGDTTDDPAIETPVIRTTGADASGASVIIGFPSGLGKITDKGDERTFTVVVLVSQSPAGTDTWTDVETLSFTSKKFEPFYRQYTWSFATRGRYDIRLTRKTDETTSQSTQSRTSWVALQTLRPEYPLNDTRPLALIALRVKATYQLNGSLDNFNSLASSRCLDWDKPTQTWILRETSNPSSRFRRALQSPSNPRAVADSGINLGQLQEWHEFCTLKGLKYDRVLEEETTLRDVLTEIAAAGRATQRHDGLQWGVVIDRPADLLVVDHVNPRNSWQFKSTRTYVDPPHAFRISFLDATNDYKQAERIVPWPGYSGEITLTEVLELPGKTDPAEVYIEARRHMYVSLYRPDVHTVTQDGPVRVATRGDLVMGSFDVLQRTQIAARVRSVDGKLVEVDETLTMVAGQTYGIRFRVFADADDTIGTSVVRQVQTIAGTRATMILSGDGQVPEADSLIHFGPLQTESMPLIVTRVEAGQDMSSLYTFVDAAPLIDELTDAEVAPAWSGRVGADIGNSTAKPPPPVFTSISTGVDGTGTVGGLQILMKPGSGPIVSQKFRVQHRLVGASVWNSIDFPATNGGVAITGYSTGNQVQLEAFAISPNAVFSDPNTVVTVTIGGQDAALPQALDTATISVASLLGGASILFSTTADAATTQMQLYRTTSTAVPTSANAVGAPIAVAPSRSYSVLDGDPTRSNLLPNSGFDTGTGVSLGPGWTISAGVASHATGTSSTLTEALAAVANTYYRIFGTLSGVTAGSLTPRLSGGTNRDGVARTANGDFSDRVQAASSNNTFGFVASSTFVGSLDNIGAFAETATCLAAGTYYYWLSPLNSDDVPGPMAGPFIVVIR